jgi:hypothetical protein
MVRRRATQRKIKQIQTKDNRRSRLLANKGIVAQCSRCHKEPVYTTPVKLLDGTSQHYCHKCLVVLYNRRDMLAAKKIKEVLLATAAEARKAQSRESLRRRREQERRNRLEAGESG